MLVMLVARRFSAGNAEAGGENVTSNRRYHRSAAVQPASSPPRKAPLRGLRHFWRPFMSIAKAIPADTPAPEPAVIVFGRDEAGKPHASWFDADSAELAIKAADLMNMRILRVETEEQKALARQL